MLSCHYFYCCVSQNKASVVSFRFTVSEKSACSHFFLHFWSQFCLDLIQLVQIPNIVTRKVFYNWIMFVLFSLVASVSDDHQWFLTSPQKTRQNSQCGCRNFDSSQMSRLDSPSYCSPDWPRPPPKPFKTQQHQIWRYYSSAIHWSPQNHNH